MLFGTWQERSFLEWNKNEPFWQMHLRVQLTGHSGYWESLRIFITLFYILSFTAHIQRFPTEITNSGGFAEIFISLKWMFFLPGPDAKITYIYRVSNVFPNPVFGKDRLIVNTWFTQILLIINRNQLLFPPNKLSTKGQLNVAQMGILLIVDTNQ